MMHTCLQLSFAFHMSKALYLLKEASFTDFQVPNLDAVKFDVSNAWCDFNRRIFISY